MKVWNAYEYQLSFKMRFFQEFNIKSRFSIGWWNGRKNEEIKKENGIEAKRIFEMYSWMYFEIYGVDCSQIISPSDVIYDLRTFDLLEQMIFILYSPIGEICPWWTSEINDWRLVRFWLLQPLRWINHSTLIVIKNWL